MRIVKLDAVDSTNDYLKNLCRETSVDNFTIVSAESQTSGRGQMGAKWHSEPYKNLTVSILIKNFIHFAEQGFIVNTYVCVALAKALSAFNIPEISIKWPNDILSGGKKIAGILIENMIRPNGEIWSVVGFGLNVNQQAFDGLPNASSIRNVSGAESDKDLVLEKIANSMQHYFSNVDPAVVKSEYLDLLFKKDVPADFSDSNGRFTGIIRNVSENGKLEIEIDNVGRRSFSLKEVQMTY